MKKIIMLSLAVLVVFGACKKKDDNVSKVVKISQPTINLLGDKYTTIHVGETYTDPGATLIDDVTGASSTIHADTPIAFDNTTPGMYTMLYSAKNANGYSSVAARYVAVTDYTEPAGTMIEGIYKRQSNGRLVHVTKENRALYTIDDFGGAGLPDAGHFAVINDTTIDFGTQYSESIGGFFTVDVKSFHLLPGDTSFSYVLHAAGYGTATRVFVKQ